MQNFSSKGKSDLKIRCYQFSLNIIAYVDTLAGKTSTRIIADQLIRCSTSIGANLVEARSASSRLEFKKYYEISLKSANETKYWLCLIRDANIANKNRTNELLQEVTEISNMLAAGVIKLKIRKSFEF